MFSFVRVAVVVVSPHSNKSPKIDGGTGSRYCCDRPDHVFILKEYGLWNCGLEKQLKFFSLSAAK